MSFDIDPEDLYEEPEESWVYDKNIVRPPYNSPFFNLDYSSIKILCDICKEHSGTFICSTCKIGCYCSTKCQKAGWKEHKSTCKKIKYFREKLMKEEEYLRRENFLHDIYSFGKFWILPETREYCQTLYALALVCHLCDLDFIGEPLPCSNAGKQAMKYSLQLIYYDRIDHLRVGSILVNQLIANDKDQWAYDFLKFQQLMDYRRDYTKIWIPYLHYWQQDLSEDVPLNSKHNDAHYIVALTLVKLRYFDLCAIKEKFCNLFLCAVDLIANHPLRILRGNNLVLHHIYSYLIPPGTFKGRSIRDTARLQSQIDLLLDEGQKANPLIWKALLNPAKLLAGGKPESYSLGTPEEAFCVIEPAYIVWFHPVHQFALRRVEEYCQTKLGGVDYYY